MSKQLTRSARKRFGQNFLVDDRVIEAILASIRASAADAIVEIGPGHGAITEGLYASQCDLTLIELDRNLVPGLLASFVSKTPGRCRLLNEDVLKVDFGQFSSPLRIVGNLPYNISTPLLFKLLELGDQIQDIHVMLQKEVVNRIAAVPGESAYGRLGVMIQATASVEPLIEVPPESFAPPPKVDSGVIRIIPCARKRSLIASMQTLTHVVRQAFSQRRKTLRNNLKDILTSEEFEVLGINPQDRPERLSVQTYVELCNYLDRKERNI
ncbi:MAG: 16S rRNA (adenine(1518)-N(6)/adenine(1519)-N(6))-dimethyltransferase RsmA [Oceanospirillales bacterium TMED33]|nr:16S rRNA (adenine(1518)-N(6)/adenine(1519)-N(6))-dimethyltransferase [Gammaproteobacteria bacterium]RPG22454.1 MAG: 16S rRNA (adenine(1518)-N(6)/adenine(1519)-N(6))-dimethyltransferase RsmA [Oceanospirillales bacterium TMED33]CAI8311424.1 MAG: Ribosomal RNA small subunit methyltransferase A [Gammaproteobacteria bacterium]